MPVKYIFQVHIAAGLELNATVEVPTERSKLDDTVLIANRLATALDEEYRRMQDEWFFKWHFIGENTSIEIDSFRGRPICYGGIKFFGSPERVYWDTIQFYLRKKISESLIYIESEIQKYPLEIRENELIQAGHVLKNFAAKIRKTAIDKDRILRGNGSNFPTARDLGSWQDSQPNQIDIKIEKLKEIYCAPVILVDGVKMPFLSMLNDKVTFAKKDGTVIKADISASVQSGMIFTWDASLPIEAGDHFLRQLPSGLVEDFIVIDPGFTSGGHGIGKHFQTKVRRSDQPTAQPQTVINNIVGNNARINIHSVDNSTNVSVGSSSAIFNEIRQALSKIEDSTKRDAVAAIISEMEAAHEKQDGSFKATYQRFIASVADHMTIIAPFLPALSGLL